MYFSEAVEEKLIYKYIYINKDDETKISHAFELDFFELCWLPCRSLTGAPVTGLR